MTLVYAMAEDEISLLEEELVKLTVKSSMIDPKGKASLISSVWTKRNFNSESFKAQMRSIWKTSKKFEISGVGQNIFLISFENENDMEQILEGRPWFFRKNLVIFDKLTQSV